MIDLDKKTLFIDISITIVVSLIFIFRLWYQHRKRYSGLSLILVYFILNVISALLIFFRSIVSDFFSIVFSNGITMISMFCILLGLEKFIGVRSKHYHIYIYLLLFLIIQSYFTWIIPNMAARNINISIGHIFFSSNLAILLYYRTPKELRNITKELVIVFSLFIVVNIVRLYDQLSIVTIYSNEKQFLMNFDIYILLLYQAFALALSFAFVQMINNRLKQDILNNEKEIILSRNILKRLIVNNQAEYENGKINLATQIDNNLNQSLAALRLNLGFIKKKMTNNEQNICPEIIKLVEQTYMQTGLTIERSLSLMNEVRNEILYLYGIEEAIKLNIEDIKKETNLICTFKYKSDKKEIDKKLSLELFILYQDIIAVLLNKNSTDKIQITLEIEKTVIRLTIIENGNSFDQNNEPLTENSVPAILKEKAALINGSLEIIQLNSTETILALEIQFD